MIYPMMMKEIEEALDALIEQSYFVASCEKMCPDAVPEHEANVQRLKKQILDICKKGGGVSE